MLEIYKSGMLRRTVCFFIAIFPVLLYNNNDNNVKHSGWYVVSLEMSEIIVWLCNSI
jgi:hypothetical protein